MPGRVEHICIPKLCLLLGSLEIPAEPTMLLSIIKRIAADITERVAAGQVPLFSLNLAGKLNLFVNHATSSHVTSFC